MEFSEALMNHLDWKIRLRTAITEHRTVNVASASNDRSCMLGSWLHGQAREQFGHLDSYRDCCDKHASFHQEAGKVVQCIDVGNEVEAKAMLGVSGSFSGASTALIEAMKRLKQDAESAT